MLKRRVNILAILSASVSSISYKQTEHGRNESNTAEEVRRTGTETNCSAVGYITKHLWPIQRVRDAQWRRCE